MPCVPLEACRCPQLHSICNLQVASAQRYSMLFSPGTGSNNVSFLVLESLLASSAILLVTMPCFDTHGGCALCHRGSASLCTNPLSSHVQRGHHWHRFLILSHWRTAQSPRFCVSFCASLCVFRRWRSGMIASWRIPTVARWFPIASARSSVSGGALFLNPKP